MLNSLFLGENFCQRKVCRCLSTSHKAVAVTRNKSNFYDHYNI